MKFWILLFSVLLSAQALADSPSPVIPLNQNLVVVDYFSNGQQTGCGLRATGETIDNLWLNILITVFRKDTGATFGVLKVVARKVNAKDGAPVLKDGKITYVDLGNIRKAWIKPDSGKQPKINKNGESSHNDAYMVDTEFSSTVDLLLAMTQENFKVGLNRNEAGPDEIFQFDKRPSRDVIAKLTVCMNNLRAALEEKKSKEVF
jgi:hypothetical protein